jgi:cyclin-dependent kinase-like
MEKNMLEVLEEKPNGLDPRLVQLFIYQLCLAIDYCHSQQVIHRGMLMDKDPWLCLCVAQ